MCPNTLLPDHYSELVQRLALGIEPVDAATDRTVHPGLNVTFDGVPRTERPYPGYCPETHGLRSLTPHPSGRFSIRHEEQGSPPYNLRLASCRSWYVARRISFPAPSLAQVEAPDPPPVEHRSRRVMLFPAAAYPAAGSVTGLRATVERNGRPMRWCRAEARVGSEVVARAHGDGAGRFLLLVGFVPDAFGDLQDPLPIELTLRGLPTAPAVPDPPPSDPLWDLPLEQAPAPGDADTVSSGEEPPAGYVTRPTGTVTVSLPLGRVSSLPEISSSKTLIFE